MAASNKVGAIYLLILYSAILLSMNPARVSAVVCPAYPCVANAGYMTCPSPASSTAKQLRPPCNCCYAPKGCTIYTTSGTPICTAT